MLIPVLSQYWGRREEVNVHTGKRISAALEGMTREILSFSLVLQQNLMSIVNISYLEFNLGM